MNCLNFANLNCVIWCQDHWAVSYWSGQASRLHATEADGTVRAPSYDTNGNECDARFGCLWWHMMLFLLQTTTRCGHSPNHILISETSRLQVKVPPKLRGAAPLWVGCSEFVEHGAFGYGPFLSIPTLWSCTWMRCVHHHHDCVLSQWPAAGMFASTPNLGASEGRVEVLEVLKAPSYLVLRMLGPSPSHLASVVPGCQERVDRMSSDLRWWQCSKVHHSGYTTRLHNLCQ